MTRPTSPLRTLAWIAALSAALAGLLRAGDQLPLPPWPAPDASATWRWLERTDPALTAFAVLRVAAVVVVAWLLVSTLILVAGALLRLPALVAIADRITVPAARRLIHHAVGAGLAVTLASTTVAGIAESGPAAAVPAASAAPFAPADVGDPADPAGGSPGTTTVAPPVLRTLPDPPVLVHLGPATAASDTTGAPPPGAPPTADAPPPPPSSPSPAPPADAGPEPDEPTAPESPVHPAPGPMTSLPPAAPAGAEPLAGAVHPGTADGAPGDGTHTDGAAGLDEHHHTIAAGDHLWGVAERTLADRWDRTPAPAEIATYLQRLIEANRGVLAVPDEPDLVFPGQVFVLPEVPAA